MRYFIVYFRLTNKKGNGFAYGNGVLDQDTYPNRELVEKSAIEKSNGEYVSCAIMNIVEVSKEDADEFTK
jgi:hypothetical protein